ncbi:hypothetical protein Trco_002794 [Trichoderma cornu-damae]|uniref:Abscission/NoCut checkpoint regulator n=1 Tax=Trichoderma cornu-damae TaxID=654480 RepID=A0A9P8QVD9_9HYPO|nr:hypothetical protein Trco_002794 [Trichoderma cornu-damae]
MPEDIDKSLLERLQALRGSSPGASPNRPAQIRSSVDVIERSKPATREDTLAARLKSLRAQHASSDSRPAAAKYAASQKERPEAGDGDDVDLMFSTDDQTLEELLGDVSPDQNPAEEPSDEQVRVLLEELSRSVPRDEADKGRHEGGAEDSDDSDGEHMQAEANDVIAKCRDEAELDAALGNADDEADSTKRHRDRDRDDADGSSPGSDVALPSLPPNLQDLPTSSSPRRPGAQADIDDITSRMAALRAPAARDSFSLPSVPSSRPSAGDAPVKRLASKTDYTDDDIDGWCTVCLDDATLRCLGCDGDPYCTRCWREMHIGPAAAFDDGSHKAVQITRAREKDEPQRVALGA